MSKAILWMANGVEECEALLVVDLLRRAGVEVQTASIHDGISVLSSHGIQIKADVPAAEADYASADLVILPGGKVGTENLSSCALVREQCVAFAGSKKVAAICAAPSILASLGLLEGKKATVHPGFESKMHGASLTHSPVAVDGNIITGQALGAAIPFSLELIRQLEGEKSVKKVAEAICYTEY